MSQAAVIAIALLAEALLIVSGVAAVLGWRLRRRRPAPATPEPADFQQHLRGELDALAEAELAPDSPQRLRQRLLLGELKALGMSDPAARAAHLDELYGGGDDESARLRRLLQREAKRVSQLLEVRDGLRELKLGYERLQRIFTQLTDPGLDPAERERITEAFRSQETDWATRLDALLARLEGATADLAGASPEEDDAEANAGAQESDARSLADDQGAALEALRRRVADEGASDPDALLAELEGIERRGRELSTCLQVLQDENDYLYEQLCAARNDSGTDAPGADAEPGHPRATADELEQALAMKDREIEELKQRLYASMESLAPDAGAHGSAHD